MSARLNFDKRKMKSKLFFIGLLSFGMIMNSFAQTNYALKFNGTDGYASATMNTGNTNSTMTMEFWFSPVATQAGTQYLADLHSISGSNKRRVMPYLNSGVIGIYCAPNTGNDNNAVTQSTGVTASPNVWYHIAVTINGSTLKMYVNGKLYITTSLTDSYALTGTEVLTLAKDYLNTTYANIKMDEVRIWSSERSEPQIKTNMYRELAGSDAGLLSYYKMSNGSGAVLSDNQIAGTYSGTLSGGYTWVASGAFADNRNALDFDGSNDYVDCGNSASVQRNGTQSFTVEAWVKPTGGVWVAAVSKFVHTASQEGYSLEIFSDNKVALLYGNNWSDWNATTSTTALTSGVWSHIAATYDGTTVKIYINGDLSQSATWTNGVTDSGTDLLIGSRSGTTFYSGQLDEVRVWTIARTATELRESMAKTLAGNEAGLAAYYRLDELDGNTVYDLSNNANNSTLTNMDAATDWVASDAFNTWIGGNSTSWFDAGNWSKGTVPTSTSNVGIYKWGLGNEATISGSPTIGNLVISSTSAPTLSSALTVNGNLILEKNLDLNGQAVTLGATSFLVEGSGRVFGTSGTISTTRTLSNIFALDVAGLGAKITTSANMGITTITRGHAQQSGGGNASILRYYDIVPTNNSSLNASLIFNYNDAELNSLTEGNLKLFKSTDNGATWTNEEGTLNVTGNTVTKTGISGFSRWTLADYTLPLFYFPEVDVQGNGNSITNNDVTPSITDDTDFGNAEITTGSVEHTFTIANTGLGSLNLTGSSPYVVITGHTGDFSLTQIPSNSIATGGNTTFKVTFNPTTTGIRSVVVSIANNDTDENPYSFTIQGFGTEAPTVTTQAVTDISTTTATGNGNITALGVPTPTAYGICWNITGTPTTANSKVDNGAASAIGTFSASMTGLTEGITYYVRAFATNTSGTSYGDEVTFTTLSLASGISELESNKIVVYPNPVVDAFSIFGIEGKATITLTDLNGKDILTKEISADEKVSINTLPNGMYIIKIVTIDGAILKKVVKR